jgi:hypothetical protein
MSKTASTISRLVLAFTVGISITILPIVYLGLRGGDAIMGSMLSAIVGLGVGFGTWELSGVITDLLKKTREEDARTKEDVARKKRQEDLEREKEMRKLLDLPTEEDMQKLKSELAEAETKAKRHMERYEELLNAVRKCSIGVYYNGPGDYDIRLNIVDLRKELPDEFLDKLTAETNLPIKRL